MTTNNNSLGIEITRGNVNTDPDFQYIQEMAQPYMGSYDLLGDSMFTIVDIENPHDTSRLSNISKSLGVLVAGVGNTEPHLRGIDAWSGSNELSLDGENFIPVQFFALVAGNPRLTGVRTEELVIDTINKNLESLSSPIRLPSTHSSIEL